MAFLRLSWKKQMVARMITCARRTIVVADASKFDFNAFAQIAPLSAIDILVTDALPYLQLSSVGPRGEANAEVITAKTGS